MAVSFRIKSIVHLSLLMFFMKNINFHFDFITKREKEILVKWKPIIATFIVERFPENLQINWICGNLISFYFCMSRQNQMIFSNHFKSVYILYLLFVLVSELWSCWRIFLDKWIDPIFIYLFIFKACYLFCLSPFT